MVSLGLTLSLFPMSLCCWTWIKPEIRRASYRRRSRLQTPGSVWSPTRPLHNKTTQHSQILHRTHFTPSNSQRLFYCPVYCLYHCCSFTIHWLILGLLSSVFFVCLTVAAVRVERVVALDVLFKPRPAETHRRRNLNKQENKTIDRRTEADTAPPPLMSVAVGYRCLGS